MQEAEKIIYTIFGGIIAIAIISVLVGKNSKAPQAIQAFGSSLASVVSAAASPGNNASNGNNGSNVFTIPHNFGINGGTWGN